ncbi:MAG: acyl-CoA dehydrogenase family protein [Acidimicrobiales bacterium]
MLLASERPPADPLLDVRVFAAELESWLTRGHAGVRAVETPIRSYPERVAAMQGLMLELFEAGWARYGWPPELGGLGGTVLHRAAMWEALARHGVPGMALFEHLEILAPTLVAMGPHGFVAEALPAFLSGRQLWAQGFSEPDAGSDLANLRTAAAPVDDGYVITGRKIWTSWARYATWCLLLARTGPPESRHRGLTAFIVDLRSAGVEVRAIEQANGTDELAEVAFDEVRVGADRIVGELGGGW